MSEMKAAIYSFRIQYNEDIINPNDVKQVITEILHRGQEDRARLNLVNSKVVFRLL